MSDTHASGTTAATDALRARLDEAFPALLDELKALVAIPSISSDPDHRADVDASAEHLRQRFEAWA